MPSALTRLVLPFCVATLLAPAAHAGVILKTVEREAASGKETSRTTLSVQDGKLLIENIPAGKTQANDVVIFKDDALIAVDHARKSYTVYDRATLERMAGGVNQAMEQLEQTMAGLTPEQRAMVEKMMGKHAPGGAAKPKAATALEFKNTGKQEKVGAYDCTVWQAQVDGQVRWQHCVVPFGKIQGGEEIVQAMKKMSALVEEVTRSLKSEWMKNSLDAGWEGIRSIDGYPVLTRSFRDGKAHDETVLVSSQTDAIPAANFEPPKGYKQEKLELELPKN